MGMSQEDWKTVRRSARCLVIALVFHHHHQRTRCSRKCATAQSIKTEIKPASGRRHRELTSPPTSPELTGDGSAAARASGRRAELPRRLRQQPPRLLQ
uniref:Uncharacterized protein n=1 Tax=Oryza punctata TaxID=4537 RepID=A0A0E0JEE3_ORYPU